MPEQQLNPAMTHCQLLKCAEDVSELYQRLKAEYSLLADTNIELEQSFFDTVLMG